MEPVAAPRRIPSSRYTKYGLLLCAVDRRLETLEQLIVVAVGANPEPEQHIALANRECSMVEPHADGTMGIIVDDGSASCLVQRSPDGTVRIVVDRGPGCHRWSNGPRTDRH